jgi:predicted TIM-barrel fold metal-dependent hydrolase
MIIDAHVHLGAEIPGHRPRGGGELVLADRLARSLADNGVERCFVFTSAGLFGDTQAGNDELARARDRAPDVLVPFGTVDAHWDDVKLRWELRRCVSNLRFSGIMLHPLRQGFSLSNPAVHTIAGECSDLEVPLIVHDGTAPCATSLQLLALAKAFPRLRVISANGGQAEGWREIVAVAPDVPNYWVCPAGVPLQGIQALYGALGPERILFGSDSVTGNISTVASALRRLRSLLVPAEHLDLMLGGNVARLFSVSAVAARDTTGERQ